jgi:hypothetical protein
VVINNFFDFLKFYFNGVTHLVSKYYRDWVATYGYWVGQVPEIVYYLFPLSIIVAYFTESKNSRFSAASRIIIFLVSIFCLGVIASVKFIIAYSPGQFFNNAQARYFLPFAPLLFLSIAGIFTVRLHIEKIMTTICASLVLVTLGWFGIGLFRTYYSECVFQVDATHPCKLPQYKNLEVQNPPIVNLNNDTVISQSFSPHCSQITALSVLLYKDESGGKGNLSLSVLDNKGQILRTSIILLNQIIEGKQIRFDFPLMNVQPFSQYSFRIKSEQPLPENGQVGLLSRKQNYYNEGELRINGALFPSAADLFFQYECPDGSIQKAGS